VSPDDQDRLRAVRRAGHERRELNALRHLIVEPMVLDTSRGVRASGVSRNSSGYAWTSTLHRLERKRQVERLKGGRFVITASGQRRLAEAVYRIFGGLIAGTLTFGPPPGDVTIPLDLSGPKREEPPA